MPLFLLHTDGIIMYRYNEYNRYNRYKKYLRYNINITGIMGIT